MKSWKPWAVAACLVACAGAAQAALFDRGGGMIYDSTRNITWLADLNHAFTSGYAAANQGRNGSYTVEADGRMGWDAAVRWASQLEYGGHTDWRLPTLDPTDASCTGGYPVGFGHNCTGGETGMIVTDLGANGDLSGRVTSDDTAEQIANRSLFFNEQNHFYWTGLPFSSEPAEAWVYGYAVGFQLTALVDVPLFATAVRSGDVASQVPEPRSLALVLAALGAAVAARRRRRGPAGPAALGQKRNVMPTPSRRAL